MTSLLQNIETSFQIRNEVAKLAGGTLISTDSGRHQCLLCPKWQEITGRGDNLAICPNCERSKSKTGLCLKQYTYGLDRQWAIAIAVKSNYFRFATIALNFMRNELSHSWHTYRTTK